MEDCRTPTMGSALVPVAGSNHNLEQTCVFDPSMIEAAISLEIDQADKQVFVQNQITIGRSEGAMCVLEHNSVSRTHAVILNDAGVWKIVDEQSANGVYVNKSKVVKSALLADGDTIGIGIYQIRIHIHGQVSPNQKKTPGRQIGYFAGLLCLCVAMYSVWAFIPKTPSGELPYVPQIVDINDLQINSNISHPKAERPIVSKLPVHLAFQKLLNISAVPPNNDPKKQDGVVLKRKENLIQKDRSIDSHPVLDINNVLKTARDQYFIGNGEVALNTVRSTLQQLNMPANDKDRLIAFIHSFAEPVNKQVRMTENKIDSIPSMTFELARMRKFDNQQFGEVSIGTRQLLNRFVETHESINTLEGQERFEALSRLFRVTGEQKYENEMNAVEAKAAKLMMAAHRYENINLAESIKHWQSVKAFLPRTHKLAVRANAKLQWYEEALL